MRLSSSQGAGSQIIARPVTLQSTRLKRTIQAPTLGLPRPLCRQHDGRRPPPPRTELSTFLAVKQPGPAQSIPSKSMIPRPTTGPLSLLCLALAACAQTSVRLPCIHQITTYFMQSAEVTWEVLLYLLCKCTILLPIVGRISPLLQPRGAAPWWLRRMERSTLSVENAP